MSKGQRYLLVLLIIFLPLQLGRHFWPSFSYVFGLRIDYLAPTVYLTDVMVFTLLGLWGIEKNRLGKLKLNFFLFSVFLFLVANSFLAANQGAAVYRLVKIIEFFFLGLYVAKNKGILRLVQKFLPIPVVYSSLLAIAQFIKQGSLNGLFWYLGERTFNTGTPGIAQTSLAGRLFLRSYATFPHPNVLAGFIVISLIITLPDLFKKSKSVAIGYLLLAMSCLILTFSRAAWLGVILALFLGIRSRLKFFLFFFLAFLIIKVPLLYQESLVQRIDLAKAAWQLIKLKPLTGVGLNNFISQLPNFWQPKILWLQPVHNIYLLIAAETGLMGLLIFLWFIFLTFKKLHSSDSSLSASLVTILFLGLFDHYWLTLPQTQLLFTLVLGLSWSKKNAKIIT